VWRAFLAAGMGEQIDFENSFIALEYRRLLQNGLLPTHLKRNDLMLFFNFRIAKATKKWLKNMFWLGQSADLSHIVNIWSHIKLQLTGRHFSVTHGLLVVRY